MAKFNLKITTPHGEFTRKATRAYTHAVVRLSPRAQEAFDNRGSATRWTKSGVTGRWIKDRGYAVTWHSSEANAHKAAAAPYMWDGSVEVVGVFPVGG